MPTISLVSASAVAIAAKEIKEDRLVAAMLLRDARDKAERAEEEGISAFLSDRAARLRMNSRLLQGEVSQLQSHNKRCGVEPLPRPAGTESGSVHRKAGEVAALEREFLRSAHQMREGMLSAGVSVEAPERKRQRVGADGPCLDLDAVREAEAHLAEDDVALANPLLRPPPGSAPKAPRKVREPDAVAASDKMLGFSKAPASEDYLWPSTGLRVRIVDERGPFRAHHLKKCVVERRNSAKRTVDVKIEGSGEIVQVVPQLVLETVVSKACSRVEVIRGEHRGCVAALLHRNSRTNEALIRLDDGGETGDITVPLDDVCEFT